MKIRL
jgi:hypothetical protein